MVAYQVIGKPAAQVEGREKVTGRGLYAVDMSLPGMLWAKVLRSPHPHARIVDIDVSKAAALPGVRAVVTGADVGDGLWGGMGVKDMPVLARGRVRFAGEPVAAVAADDEETADRALQLIDARYEVLPPVYGIFEAMAPGAPIIHPEFNDYPGVYSQLGEPDVNGRYNRTGLPELSEPSNCYNHWTIHRGDVEKGFAEADEIFEHEYTTQRIHQAYLEPRNALVSIDEGGRVDAWLSTKTPYTSRSALATAAGLPESQVVIHPTLVGGDFGGKGAPVVLGICYFLARQSGRPVKLVYDYVEELTSGNGRHEVVIRMKTGVKRDGTLAAHQVWYYTNSGAYACFKPWGTIWGPTQAAGVYRVPNCRVDQYHVYTNTLPGGFMRMPGEVQAFFALESHIDEMARALGIDPLEFRLRNLIEDGEVTGAGILFEGVRARETLQAAAEAAGYSDPKPANVGRGIAICQKPAGGGEGRASVTLKPDGSVVLGTAVFDQGTGTRTVMRQVAAEELQLPLDRVQIEVWDTSTNANDSGIAASRGTRIGSIVVYGAVDEAKRKLFRLAADRLGWPEDQLSLRGGEIWRADLEESIPWPRLLAEANQEVIGYGAFRDPERATTTSFAAQVAEVQVDQQTGEVKVLRFTSAHDVGKVINPAGHQGQIAGAIAQGLGYALMEELVVEDGRVGNVTLGDYKLPNIKDLPPLRTVLLEDGGGVGPYRIKGIGEPPTGAVAPAIASAIADAAGVRLRDLPITAEKMHRALRQAASTQG
jgi:carbon-monoxide dehydrogenase large subunit